MKKLVLFSMLFVMASCLHATGDNWGSELNAGEPREDTLQSINGDAGDPYVDPDAIDTGWSFGDTNSDPSVGN